MTVGRPPKILRPVKMTIYLPEDVKAKLDLHLFSAVEGRVPHGDYSKFISERVREFFDVASPAAKLVAFKTLIQQTELSGWNEEQRIALEALRDHLLDRYPA